MSVGATCGVGDGVIGGAVGGGVVATAGGVVIIVVHVHVELITPRVGLRAGNDAGDIGILVAGGAGFRGLTLLGFRAPRLLLLLALLAGALTGALVLRGS